MQDLMSIGRFSAATGLTVKALRLYDRLGLLQPALVDFASGYRYYSPDQVRVAEDIRLLRSMDMPLSEIQNLLTAPDRASVEAHLMRHVQRIADRIKEYQDALARFPSVDEWCRRTGKEELMETEVKTYTCSFCSKDRSEVKRMIAGPNGVIICNECVALCNEIIAKEEPTDASA